jgi:EamA domain-containing membrane protein RarD
MLEKNDARTGLAAIFAVNLVWGLMPLYIKLIGFASPWEIVSVRVL